MQEAGYYMQVLLARRRLGRKTFTDNIDREIYKQI
jgi:hypothetical protein